MSRTRIASIMKSDRGAAALEFAVVVPLLIVLMMGMFEFGFIFQGQLAVTHAAREGARLASVQDGALFTADAVEGRAYPLRIADGLSISLTEPDEESVRVTVSYPWAWRIFPLANAITLTSSATMRQE